MAKIFSILADKTLCIRYVKSDTLILSEYFLQFVSVTNLTGARIAKTLLDTLHNLNIDSHLMIGQIYDEAVTMSGRYNDTRAYVREKNDLVLYGMHF